MATNIPALIPYPHPSGYNYRKSSELTRDITTFVTHRPFLIAYPVNFKISQFEGLREGDIFDLTPEDGPIYTYHMDSRCGDENLTNVWVPCVRRWTNPDTNKEFLGVYIRMTTERWVNNGYVAKKMRIRLGFKVKKFEVTTKEVESMEEEGFQVLRFKKLPPEELVREVPHDIMASEFETYGTDDFIPIEEIMENKRRFFDRDDVMKIEMCLTIKDFRIYD